MPPEIILVVFDSRLEGKQPSLLRYFQGAAAIDAPYKVPLRFQAAKEVGCQVAVGSILAAIKREENRVMMELGSLQRQFSA